MLLFIKLPSWREYYQHLKTYQQQLRLLQRQKHNWQMVSRTGGELMAEHHHLQEQRKCLNHEQPILLYFRMVRMQHCGPNHL